MSSSAAARRSGAEAAKAPASPGGHAGSGTYADRCPSSHVWPSQPSPVHSMARAARPCMDPCGAHSGLMQQQVAVGIRCRGGTRGCAGGSGCDCTRPCADPRRRSRLAGSGARTCGGEGVRRGGRVAVPRQLVCHSSCQRPAQLRSRPGCLFWGRPDCMLAPETASPAAHSRTAAGCMRSLGSERCAGFGHPLQGRPHPVPLGRSSGAIWPSRYQSRARWRCSAGALRGARSIEARLAGRWRELGHPLRRVAPHLLDSANFTPTLRPPSLRSRAAWSRAALPHVADAVSPVRRRDPGLRAAALGRRAPLPL